jgi:26S proteasome regulatory subunit N9
MNVDTIADFLAEQRDEAPEELQGLIIQFENLWERKLWHQLTDALVEFFEHPDSTKQRLQFYKVFILKFADKINQLKLVDLGLNTATACKGKRFHTLGCPSLEKMGTNRHHQTTKSDCPSSKISPKRSTTRTHKMPSSTPPLL